MNWLLSLLIALLPSLTFAQVVSVEFKDKGFLFSDAPTQTFLWPAKQPKATLVFIPTEQYMQALAKWLKVGSR